MWAISIGAANLWTKTVSKKNDKHNRSDIEILGDLLNIANGGTLKNHLRSRANLDHKQFYYYEKFAREMGLLSVMDERQSNYPINAKKPMYKTTGKGLAYAYHYNKLVEMLDG